MAKEYRFKHKCGECKSDKDIIIPKEIVALFDKCGVSENQRSHIYMTDCLSNIYFSSFGTVGCDICGKNRVLVYWDGYSPSGCNVISAVSSEINFWPNYDYPSAEVRICKWCMPNNDDHKSRVKYIESLHGAMLKRNEEIEHYKHKLEARKS
jgi:hypothetical protein